MPTGGSQSWGLGVNARGHVFGGWQDGQGVHSFFITDDNFARNKDWERIFDRLIALREEHGLSLFIATGGTLARKIVQEAAPEAIVAVACERDLSSGVVDTYPLPVLGIPGWWAANDSPDFYADAEVFRQQRRVASEQIPAREA